MTHIAAPPETEMSLESLVPKLHKCLYTYIHCYCQDSLDIIDLPVN